MRADEEASNLEALDVLLADQKAAAQEQEMNWTVALAEAKALHQEEASEWDAISNRDKEVPLSCRS